jgi:hypothetical protein
MRTYLILLTILIASSSRGQKAPVRYIPIDSISTVPPGLDVKLDFKGKTVNNVRIRTAYPWLRTAKRTGTGWTGDTVNLTIDKRNIEFIEWKGLGADYYYFPAERLESTTYKDNHVLTVRSSTIRKITSDSVKFRLTIELDKKKANGKWNHVYSKDKDLWIRETTWTVF